MGDSDDDKSTLSSSEEERVQERDRKRSSNGKSNKDRKKSDNRKKKSKKSRKRDRSDDSSSSESEASRDRKRRKKDRKKDKKKDKKRHRSSKRKKLHVPDHSAADDTGSTGLFEQNYALADALCSLFESHAALSADLPIMLVRLAGGTAFDLSQMTDQRAAVGLDRVFTCMGTFGVVKTHEGWTWKNPASGNNTNELVLVRVVRALLDQIGLTHAAVEQFEGRAAPNPALLPPAAPEKSAKDDNTQRITAEIEKQTAALLQEFKTGGLDKELPGLLQLILDGEMVQLEGLPDEKLRRALESLLSSCGLEKSAMEEDSDEEDDQDGDDDEPALGYGLPERGDEAAKSMLATVLQFCSTNPSGNTSARRPIKGPMLNPDAYAGQQAVDFSESSEDEGPLPFGAIAKAPGPSKEFIKQKAARRAKELACAKSGVAMDPSDGNAREEWMLVPGKFDFLSAIKSGQPIRSRTFEAKSKAQGAAEAPVDPAVRAEIHSIRQAAEEARGPSLMEQHRQGKKEAAAIKAAAGNGESWKWSRDNDLDSGRRVDTDALNMILGGAGSDLKQKFQSSI